MEERREKIGRWRREERGDDRDESGEGHPHRPFLY